MLTGPFGSMVEQWQQVIVFVSIASMVIGGFGAIGGNMDLAVDDYLAHNINYLRDVLGVKLPPPG